MLHLRAGETEAVVDPEGGGRLVRLAVGGVDLLTPAGCFLMAPWAGRTGFGTFDGHRLPIDQPPHAIHGTVRGVAWTVLAADRTALAVRSAAKTDGVGVIEAPLGPVWPWPGRATQRFELHADHLAIEAELTTDGEPFPAALGWHPWFVKPERVELHAAAMLERGPDGLPTGRRVDPVAPGTRPLDDCFEGVRWPVVLHLPGGRRIEVDADGCDHAVVYDEQAGATCVEPQTAPPDALRTGEAAVVTATRPLRAAVRLTWPDP